MRSGSAILANVLACLTPGVTRTESPPAPSGRLWNFVVLLLDDAGWRHLRFAGKIVSPGSITDLRVNQATGSGNEHE